MPTDNLLQLARQHEDAGDLTGAALLARQAVEIDPQSAEAHLTQGRIAAKMRQVPEAISHLRKALELDSICFEAMIWLIPVLRTNGSPDEALEIAERARKLKPDDAASHSLFGSCLLALNRAKEAAEAYRRAVEFDPDQAFLHRQMGDALRRTGQITEVIECYRRALEIEPRSVPTLVALAQAVSMTGDRRAGALLYRRAHDLEPGSPRGLLSLARAAIDEEDPAAAEGPLRESIRQDPKSYTAQILLGSVQRRLGRFDEAEAQLRSAIAANPRSHQAYTDLVYCRRMKEEDRPLIVTLASMASNESLNEDDLAQIEYALGKAFDDLSDYEQAMAHFDEANRRMLEIRTRRNPARSRDLPEPMFFSASREELSAAAARGYTSETPVLVVGMMRSGTTLTERMLSAHTQVRGAGELEFWPNELERPGVRPEDLPTLGQRFCELLSRFGPSARVVDKMPGNYRRLGAIHTALPGARFVHLRRSPVDTCVSIWTTPNRADVPFAHDQQAIVRAYREYERLMDRWREVLPKETLLEVQYEELVRNSEPVMRALLEFLGLPFEEACLHPEANRGQVETPSLWQARQPLYSSSVDRWKRYEPWLGGFRELIPEG